MRNIRIILALFAVLSLAASAPAQEAAGLKIAIANPARIFNEMQETKDLQAKMESERKNLLSLQQQKQAKVEELKGARDQLKPDAPEFQTRNQELLQAAIELDTWGKLTTADVQRRQKTQMKQIFEKIQSAVAEVAQQKGYTLVLAEQHPDLPENLDQINLDQLRGIINSRNILYSVDAANISNDVIALLDQKYKSGQ